MAGNRQIKINPLSPAVVRNFWRHSSGHPSRRLGQNFLIDANVARIIVDAAGLDGGDSVLEIGPGLGALTGLLAAGADHVTAVEKDHRLYAHLVDMFADAGHVRLIHADALSLDYAGLMGVPEFKVVANLPYSTGTAILVNFLRMERPPAGLTVTLQLEVVRRLAAAPGEADYGLLGLWAALDYSVVIKKTISPTCFWPVPRVKSAVVCLRRRAQPQPLLNDREFFFEFTKQAFSVRRKQLSSILRNLEILRGMSDKQKARLPTQCGLDPRSRPENLGVAEWCRLATLANQPEYENAN